MRLALGALLLPCSAQAVEVHAVEVAHEGARYRIAMRVTLDAPASDSYAAFAHPTNLPRINPAVREVRVLDAPSTAQARVYTRVEACVSLYCRRLEQVQDMRYAAGADGGEVHADVLPQLSDFRFGRAQWLFRDCNGRTCLAFNADLEPAFWVPPLIGPWLIQRKLREEAIATSRGLERLARGAVP